MLFEQGRNPIQLIKIKQWRKVLEYATDKAEDGPVWRRVCPEERA